MESFIFLTSIGFGTATFITFQHIIPYSELGIFSAMLGFLVWIIFPRDKTIL